jgi:hypothetical protein
MFWNKALFLANIAKVSFTIDKFYYVVDHRFGKYPTKHDKHMTTKTFGLLVSTPSFFVTCMVPTIHVPCMVIILVP